MKLVIQFAIVWGIAGLNILGIKENARFTFGIFFVVTLVLLTLLARRCSKRPAASWAHDRAELRRDRRPQRIRDGDSSADSRSSSSASPSCILAYSGIESVVQTAGLVKSWRDIGKAYIFLAVTIGIFTPLISALVLSSGIDPAEHETDLHHAVCRRAERHSVRH